MDPNAAGTLQARTTYANTTYGPTYGPQSACTTFATSSGTSWGAPICSSQTYATADWRHATIWATSTDRRLLGRTGIIILGGWGRKTLAVVSRSTPGDAGRGNGSSRSCSHATHGSLGERDL